MMERLLVLLLLVIVIAFAAPKKVASQQYVFTIPPVVHVDYDLRRFTHDYVYTRFIKPTLRSEGSAPPYEPRFFRNRAGDPPGEFRYVLGRRRPDFYDAPLRWMEIHLIFGDAPEDQTILNIATDDAYLLGFRNGTGQQFVFKGGFRGLADAIVLPFSHNYEALRPGGGYKNFWQVPLGNESAVASSRVLAYCDLGGVPSPILGDALVKLIIMFPEAIRFRAIRDVFSTGGRWNQQTYMSPRQAMFLGNWGGMSRLAIKHHRTGIWGRDALADIAEKVARETQITNEQQVLDIIDFLIRPRQNEL